MSAEPLDAYAHAQLVLMLGDLLLLGGTDVPDRMFLRNLHIEFELLPLAPADATAKRTPPAWPVSVHRDITGMYHLFPRHTHAHAQPALSHLRVCVVL